MITKENATIESLELEDTALEDMDYIECRFINCKFTDMKMRHCHFKNCMFENCVFSNIKFTYCSMFNSDLTESVFIGVTWAELMTSKVNIPIMSKVDKCTFRYNYFHEMNLKQFSFEDSIFVETYFDHCNLSQCSFKGTRLGNSQFTNNDMKKADFRDASEYVIDTVSNKLQGAKFSFPEVTNLLNGLGIKIE